ncbi:unnamed protein product [Taenia asiatica]|uniref:F-box domain-containing protein n=1 Tax=Taenia asiatica TaxID=60517 RepID=A0A0R3VUY7_TAEAS|nr:unnamed protein product [Taenia asiatica]
MLKDESMRARIPRVTTKDVYWLNHFFQRETLVVEQQQYQDKATCDVRDAIEDILKKCGCVDGIPQINQICMAKTDLRQNRCLTYTMAQENKGRTITELPFELPLRLCEYLDAADLVNICTALPNWKSILSTRRSSTVMAQHIKQWTWLDGRLCQLLFPLSSQISFDRASDAIRYHTQQTHSCQALLSALPHDQAHRTIRFRLLPFFNIDKMAYCECIWMLESPRIAAGRDIPLSRYPLNVRFARRSNLTIIGDRHDSGLDYLVVRSADAANDEEPDDFDCIIYVVYRFLVIGDEIKAIMAALEPHQTLVIALAVNAEKDKSSEMKCFARFIDKIGGVCNSVLSAAPPNWRLWCIRREGEDFINWSDLLEWACYDVIAKRM